MTDKTEKLEENLEPADVDAEVDYDLEALELEKKDKEIEALTEKYKRLAAEYDNYRKRTLKEKLEIRSSAVMDVVEKFLPVIDNLDRAEKILENIEDEEIRKGLKMVTDQIRETFDELGIVEVDCCDEFDPNCHEAIMHIEDESYGENTIAEVFQKGYKLNDKVIRCAVVKVAN